MLIATALSVWDSDSQYCLPSITIVLPFSGWCAVPDNNCKKAFVAVLRITISALRFSDEHCCSL
ncbi:MAG TPA: hypothetical protein PLR54_02515 [Spirochaetota bacterium]|nr:hypothetical protein [Spirochaetota bacterium]HOR94954.1 hypothetical protein [Spirochaetota bacterium]HOT18740.1 hypothetical protein [Spirochaetota bacterium]HPD05668.1 hypothetical protein [Spirochaetota bacterium]HPK43724.1 hypothetical protein [Spirochaetota bacterium]